MQEPQQVKEFVTKVLEIVNKTPTVKSFKVEIPRDTEAFFLPGQFYMVSFTDNSEIKTARAYSISSSPLQKDYLEIALNKVGPFTTKMFELREGNLLKFKGPYGKFYFNEGVKENIVLVGGGTGITPLISILRYCTDKKLANKVQLFYSVRLPEEIVFHDEIKRIKEQNPNFEYFITITRGNNIEWEGYKGRINLELLKNQIENPEQKLYFLCGPKEFVDSIISMLQSMRVKKEQIKTDVWG